MGQPDGDQLNNSPASQPEQRLIQMNRTTPHTPTCRKEVDKTKSSAQSEQDGTEVSPEVRDRLRRLDGWRRAFLTARRFDERLKLLTSFGLSDRNIATAIPNTADRSVRRWRTEGAPTRIADRWEPVDDLCAIIGYFLSDGTHDEEAIISWLRSRQPELGTQRPIEKICAGEFDAVLAAAESSLSSTIANDSELAPLSSQDAGEHVSTHER